MEKPTRAQQKVLNAIKTFIANHEYPPTIRDIMKIMGLKSTGTVHKHLKNLRLKMLIKKENGVSRSITLIEDNNDVEIIEAGQTIAVAKGKNENN